MVLQVNRPNQQYQRTEGKTLQKYGKPRKANNTKYSNTIKRYTYKNTASPLVYTNMG